MARATLNFFGGCRRQYVGEMILLLRLWRRGWEGAERQLRKNSTLSGLVSLQEAICRALHCYSSSNPAGLGGTHLPRMGEAGRGPDGREGAGT